MSFYNLTEDEPVHVERRFIVPFSHAGRWLTGSSVYLLCPNEIYQALKTMGIDIKHPNIQKLASLILENEKDNPHTHVRVIYDFIIPRKILVGKE